MNPDDPKTYLWSNIEALMGGTKRSLDMVHDRTKASRGSLQRLREAKTSVGIDLLVEIAKAFNIGVWDLLKPPNLVQGEGAAVRHSLEDCLRTLASQLDQLDETQREAVADRLVTLTRAPDSAKALSSVLSSLSGSGEFPDAQEAVRATGT